MEKVDTIEKLDSVLAELEGLKEQVNIAQIKEVRKHLCSLIAQYPQILILALQNGVKTLMRDPDSGC